MKISNRPFKTGFIAFVASIGCIAVGFSSWSISLGNNFKTANGTITVDTIESGTYFSASMIKTEVNSIGFVTDETVSPTGKFQLVYTILNYQSLIGISDSMTFKFSVGYDSSIGTQDLFDSTVCTSTLDGSSSSNVSGYSCEFSDDHLSANGQFTVSIPDTYSKFDANVNFVFNGLTFSDDLVTALDAMTLSVSTEVTIN